MITFVVEAKFIIMKHSYLSGISVKEVIRRGTLWMENRVKPDYTQMSIEWSRKNNSYPDTPSGDPVAVSLKVLKKHF